MNAGPQLKGGGAIMEPIRPACVRLPAINPGVSTAESANIKRKTPESNKEEVVRTTSPRYCIESFIGEGCYGKVAKCLDLVTKQQVALKILRKDTLDPYHIQKVASVMDAISVLDPVKCSIAKFLGCFEYVDTTCLVFEMLEICLYNFLIQRDWVPLSLIEIRPISQQLLMALNALKTIGVIHFDIKPDNIMLVSQKDEPFRVKLVDFCRAEKSSDVYIGKIGQPTGYRAPEVMLGLPFNESIDMWGVGCVLAFLYLAGNLFSVKCDYQIMKSMVLMLGEPQEHHLRDGLFTNNYFVEEQYQQGPVWRIMTREEFQHVNGILPEKDIDLPFPGGLGDIISYYPDGATINMDDRRAFASLLKGMLQFDPRQRLTPQEALENQFITMAHLAVEAGSPYVTDACTVMSVCQDITDTPSPLVSEVLPLDVSPAKETRLQKLRTSFWHIISCLRPQVKD